MYKYQFPCYKNSTGCINETTQDEELKGNDNGLD